jgi:prepilin-type N-terminal cleavage/methylation domain-containing protein
MIMMNNRKAFTIVELLIVVTIIALLLGILLPSITMVRTKAKETAQKAQFATIDMALEAFKQDYGDYPPSDWQEDTNPPSGRVYCGAQKLSEALLGWDLMGFHPKTSWRIDGYTGTVVPIGGADAYDPGRVRGIATLSERKGPYLEVAKTNVFQLSKLFNNTNLLAPNTFVLCDVFKVRKTIDKDSTGKLLTAGAPILYYRANTSSKIFDPNIVVSNTSYRIYDYTDNDPLVQLGKLTANGSSGLMHPLGYSVSSDNPVFYNDTYKNAALLTGYGGTGTGYGIRNPKITQNVWPYRPDSYILISAGPDGYYGTADDIHNY